MTDKYIKNQLVGNPINTTKRFVLYALVSTLDKGQDPETQLIQLRGYAKARNFEVITEFIDYASGTSKDRRQYTLMMECIKKCEATDF